MNERLSSMKGFPYLACRRKSILTFKNILEEYANESRPHSNETDPKDKMIKKDLK